jgi:hypothetical protein
MAFSSLKGVDMLADTTRRSGWFSSDGTEGGTLRVTLAQMLDVTLDQIAGRTENTTPKRRKKEE